MSGRKLTWKKGCGMGCLTLGILGGVVVTMALISLNRHYARAFDAGEQLTRLYGDRMDYDPGAGPVVSDADMSRFLEVREDVMDQCACFRDNNAEMRGMNLPAEPDRVPPGVVVQRTILSFRGMLGAAKGLGDFAIERNQALLRSRMGFGQYMWIYAMSYYGGLGKSPVLHATKTAPGRLSPGISAALAVMMERRASGLEAAADGAVDPAAAARLRDEAAVWRDEEALMREDPARPPFRDGPPAILQDLADTYRDRLEPLFCTDTDALELLRIKEKGAGFEDR